MASQQADNSPGGKKRRRRRKPNGAKKPNGPKKPSSPKKQRPRPPAGTITFPADLPITGARADLEEAIAGHQVVIVAGETGSGKSTQLPKLLLAMGRGAEGWIGHTQPRRLAARSVAERVADELGTTIGKLVGYKVRFTDRVGADTIIKSLTDGMLLAEIQQDPKLRRYDTLILDEAHERSLNIDFLLGFIHRLLPQRPDLKVIITSATIDTAKFSKHFGDAPVIEVSGRSYPVELRWNPPDEEDTELAVAIADAVEEVLPEGPGDILVFHAGERQINESADELRKRRISNLEVLPLYGRLSAADQHKVFAPGQQRRVVLATNVAETSLTVPRIRYVIDPGLARMSRFSMRTKVQRLPIEKISQASANQRSGRCGRLGPGICIRLYAEEDFESRPPFTEPEITRTNLASVILQMASLGLGEPADFPFVDPPDSRALRDGITLLEELDAVDPEHRGSRRWLTPTGRRMARLPVDPRLGRMLIEADHYGCVQEAAVIIAALSVQDPREWPQNKREQATEAHERHRDPDSDFVGWLHLWEWISLRRSELSGNQFRRMCGREFLNWNRVREWIDIHNQILRVLDDLEIPRTSVGHDHEAIHRALLSGLLSQVGSRIGEGREFQGPRGMRFTIARDSALHEAKAGWVMTADLLETNRLWARSVAKIQPRWVEEAAGHLVDRTWTEPLWSPERGAAMVDERVSLHGLTLVGARPMELRRVEPVLARDMLIHHGLIEQDWELPQGEQLGFIDRNAVVLEELRGLQARARTAELMAEYEALHQFFDERVPADVATLDQFTQWWNRERQASPDLFDLELRDLLDVDELDLDEASWPAEWPVGDRAIALRYEFDHLSPSDGVTAEVPVGMLGALDEDEFSWNVPGLRRELVTELIRSLPKETRKQFVPVPGTVAELLPSLQPGAGNITAAVQRALDARPGGSVKPGALDINKLPPRLRINFEAIDESGQVVGRSRDLRSLRGGLQQEIRKSLTQEHHGFETNGLTRWSIGTLPRTIETDAAGHRVTAYPALIDAGDSVAVRVLPTRTEQHRAMRRGTRRLLRLTTSAPIRDLRPLLTNDLRLSIGLSSHRTLDFWVEDIVLCAIDAATDEAGGPAWDGDAFAELQESVRSWVSEHLVEVATEASWILRSNAAVVQAIAELRNGPSGRQFKANLDDAEQHRSRLVYDWHLSGVGRHRLLAIDRYLRGIEHRLERLPRNPKSDTTAMASCRPLDAQFWKIVDAGASSADVETVMWRLEELRVQQFAQQIGTAEKVSPQRIARAISDLR